MTNSHHTYVQLNRPLPALPVDQDGNLITADDSEAFQTWHEEASSITIGQALSESFPALFMEELNDAGDGCTIEPSNPNMEVVTQGVAIDLSTQLYWL